MSTALRLGLYGLLLAAVFVAMFVAGRAFIPDSTVATWTEKAEQSADHDGMDESGQHSSVDHPSGADHTVSGLAVEQGGYLLRDLEAPEVPGRRGKLDFTIVRPDGRPLTDYSENHEKELHLIVVRDDGAGYRHAHPELDSDTGRWSIPWRWALAGTHRVYVDFVPAGAEETPLTLARNFEVAGQFDPQRKRPTRAANVSGFEVGLSGELRAGKVAELTFEVSRNGHPVSHLEPYLGAFGHLVVLREGDLAYLHAHADEGHETEGGEGTHQHGQGQSGPRLDFAVETPSVGRYLLCLDFKVEGEVHTAEFVLEAK